MLASKHKKSGFQKISRIIILFFIFGTIVATLSYTLFNNLKQVNVMKKELKDLEKENNILIEKEYELNADIKRLSDPVYIAKYAREKYFYSKDGELVLRISD